MLLPLFAELKRRRVFRALVGYGIAAFAVLQVIEPIMHGLHWPDAVLSYVVAALALGFPLVVTLAWIFDVNSGRIERTAPAPGLTGLRLIAVLVGIGVLAAAPGVLYYFVFRGRGPSADEAVPATTSVAVLPFVNMSSDKETDYFSDGITEELINALANIEGLRVASRTAVFSMKGKSLGIRQIGDELNVSTFLEGSIRREGNALRVTAQLINVRDGYHLWSQTYDRELKSIFAVEDEIARAIAQALRRKLVGVKPATASPQAHDLYLKGLYFWNMRNAEALRKAADYFEQAIGMDPGYALAYVGLADAAAVSLDYDVVSSAEIIPKARQNARRALEIDPGLAEAHASLGLISSYDFDWATSLKELQTAIDLKPDYAMAYKWRGNTLVNLGRFEEARAALGRALQLEPNSLIINLNLAELRYVSRDYAGAAEQFRKTLEMDPGFEPAHVELAQVYAVQGKHDEALAELEKVHAVPAIAVLSQRAWTLALAGRREEARSLLRDLEQRGRREYVPALSLAQIQTALGDKDEAFSLLKKGCARREPGLVLLRTDPSYDLLRSEARFKALLKCANLE